MEKEKIILPIGNNKALLFDADPGNKEDQDFAKRCKDVAATKPQTIQVFFIRLNEEQKLNKKEKQNQQVITIKKQEIKNRKI